MNAMPASGHIRAHIIQSSVTGFRRQVEAAAIGGPGGPPINWPRSYQREESRNKKLTSRLGSCQYDVVSFFPAAGGSWFMNSITKIMQKEGQRI